MPTLIQRIRKFFFRLPDWYFKVQENAMGYRSYEEMYTEYADMFDSGLEPLYKRREGLPLTTESLKNAMIVYGKAGRPRLEFLVLGRVRDEGVSTPQYSFIDDVMAENFLFMSEKRGDKGSTLNSNNWSFLMNDLFMAGAVANNQPFYLASRRTRANLWRSRRGKLTIFGREIAGLFAAGYELVHLQDGSEAMVPPCEGETRFLNLQLNNSALRYFLADENLGFIYHPRIRRFLYNNIDKTFEPVFYD